MHQLFILNDKFNDFSAVPLYHNRRSIYMGF